MSPLSLELNKVSSSNTTWQGHEKEDLIAPCKEKLQQLLSCCQDVAHVVETLEARMQSGRPQEAPAMLEVDNTNTELSLLRDELSRSKLHNKELEVAMISMEKKFTGMEEKIQALSAQLMVYKEDFDLERQDRERAQGRLIELEQQLLVYQRPYESHRSRATLEPCAANAHSSGSHHQHHHYLSNELMPRGRDVCDYYQTDGVADDRSIEERSVMRFTETDCEQNVTRDRGCPSLELRAQSFNIFDFLPLTAAAPEVVAEDGGNTTERDELCADGVEMPSPRTGALSVAFPPSKPLVDQYKPQPDLYSWSGLDLTETVDGSLNLYQVDSSRLLPENSPLGDSHLMCPKCHMRFSCRDHLLLLDHLEEC